MDRVLAFLHRCWRCVVSHTHRHRRKYASGAMIYSALIFFGADAAHTLAVTPIWFSAFLESQNWAIPVAALLGHAGFILERSA